MKTTKFLGIYAPVMIITVFMSAIAFTGCSQDDETDECEETYKTHVEMMMTRAGESILPVTTDTLKASKTFTKDFQFQVRAGNTYRSIYRVIKFEVKIYRNMDKTYKATISTKDEDVSLRCISLGINGNQYTVTVDASINNPAHNINLLEPECFHSTCYVSLP
ncbi:MAG: hypothetical protein NC206_08600 [Bacteroides sp.]|nr:hypothetical protein [Roseburia sp.]MCM1347129.1 hypothetical protein [Bacteroides sp.]MCM1421634.1 hypothetical protein [Bacteroides sp.]